MSPLNKSEIKYFLCEVKKNENMVVEVKVIELFFHCSVKVIQLEFQSIYWLVIITFIHQFKMSIFTVFEKIF